MQTIIEMTITKNKRHPQTIITFVYYIALLKVFIRVNAENIFYEQKAKHSLTNVKKLTFLNSCNIGREKYLLNI